MRWLLDVVRMNVSKMEYQPLVCSFPDSRRSAASISDHAACAHIFELFLPFGLFLLDSPARRMPAQSLPMDNRRIAARPASMAA